MFFLDVERRLLLCPSLHIKLRVPKEVLTKAKEGLINCRKVGDRWLRNSNMMKRCMQVPPLPSNLKTCSIRSVTCSNTFGSGTVIRYCIRSECQWRSEMCTNRGQIGVPRQREEECEPEMWSSWNSCQKNEQMFQCYSCFTYTHLKGK